MQPIQSMQQFFAVVVVLYHKSLEKSNKISAKRIFN